VINVRQRLGELMQAGLGGRSLRGAWRDFNRRLAEHNGGQVSWEAFLEWENGTTFPATALRQKLLGDVVGGTMGHKIQNLLPPAFRGYAQALMKDRDMSSSKHGVNRVREFPSVMFRDGGGQTIRKAMIACVVCNEHAFHHRRGNMDSDTYFEKEGWLVGSNAKGDKCPACRKVVHMKTRVIVEPTPQPQQPPPQATGADRVLIGMTISDNFDEAAARYRSGWSDVRVAETLGKPIEWVRVEREHLYLGSNGDNPDADALVAELTALHDSQSAFDKRTERLARTAADTEALFKKLQEAQQTLRVEVSHLNEDRDKIRERMERLLGVAMSIVPNGARRA
jgi:hypothetical protein